MCYTQSGHNTMRARKGVLNYNPINRSTMISKHLMNEHVVKLECYKVAERL